MNFSKVERKEITKEEILKDMGSELIVVFEMKPEGNIEDIMKKVVALIGTISVVTVMIGDEKDEKGNSLVNLCFNKTLSIYSFSEAIKLLENNEHIGKCHIVHVDYFKFQSAEEDKSEVH